MAGHEKEKTGSGPLVCSICESVFHLQSDGGIVFQDSMIQRASGIRLVAFCARCYASVVGLVSQAEEGDEPNPTIN